MRVLAALAVVLCLAVAASAQAPRHTLFNVQGSPVDWQPVGSAEQTDAVTFIVALKQNNLEKLNSAFERVSEPASPLYQQYLSIDEINNMVRPAPRSYRVVRSWLAATGVAEESVTDLGDALEVKTTAEVAANLFQASFRRFQHGNGARLVRAASAYSVPVDVAAEIDLVAGLTEFPEARHIVRPSLAARANGAAATAYNIIPSTLYKQYNIQEAGLANVSQGVIEFEGQSFAPSDLQTFSQQVNVPLKKLANKHIVGPNDPSQPGDESTLDIELIAAVNDKAENWFWLEGGETWLLGFAQHFAQTKEVPEVISISYGWNEEQQCVNGIGGAACGRLGIDSVQYVNRVNTEFQKIGLRGVSILVASGDSGANGRSDGGCTESHLNPSFPASSPFVTAVGATQLVQTPQLQGAPPACSAGYGPCATSGVEQAVSYNVAEFASGGGFSNVATRPSYQAKAVDAYLNSGVQLPPSSYFNGTYRGFPDVAAAGNAIIIVLDGSVQPVGGTSASTPIFAGVISRLNAASKAKNGKTLGFLNPFLYQMSANHPAAFNDITVGDNKCTEEGCNGCKGFEVSQGWDPVTGLGSPNYGEMLNYLQSN